MRTPQKQSNNKTKKGNPIKGKEEVTANPDPRIDQDFPGYPHHPSKEKIIDPQNGEDKATSGMLPGKATQKKKKTNEPEILRKELSITPSKKKSRRSASSRKK